MTSGFKFIALETDDRGVATLTLNRPEIHHALNSGMISEMAEAASILHDDDSRVVLIRSEGPTFCAGADLGWMKEQLAADREGKIAEATKLAMMLKAFHDLPKPVISRVQGQAFGGGLGVMAMADSVISVDTARFSFTEARLGLIPATIGPFTIAKMGREAARAVFITASMMSAGRAAELGLVSQVVPAGELDEAVAREVQTALNAAPGAMARAKAMLLRITSPDLDKQIEQSIALLADCWETEETKRGIEAFLSKTQAPWVKDQGGSG